MLYETSISMIWKPDKYITRKRNYESVFLISIVTKIQNKYLPIESIYIYTHIHICKYICLSSSDQFLKLDTYIFKVLVFGFHRQIALLQKAHPIYAYASSVWKTEEY